MILIKYKNKISHVLLMVFFLFVSLLISSQEIKCPKCGFNNSGQDRYCIECLAEIRDISKEDTSNQTKGSRDKIRKSYDKAVMHFNKAERTKDIKEALINYEIAERNSNNALSLGKDELSSSEIKDISKVYEKSKEELKSLRRINKLSDKAVKLTRKGNAYFVEVLFNNKVKANMHLDTGCSLILISEELAAKLEIKNGKKTMAVVADGRTVEATYIELKSVSVSGHEVKNVPAVYHKTSGDGLLGMSFLNSFNFKIDQEDNLLILEPRR